MSALGEKAVACANASGLVFAKFLSANETGETKSHQCGIYVPKNSASLMFDAPFAPGENHVREVSITWNGEFSTKSLFKYYGTGTRDAEIVRWIDFEYKLFKRVETGYYAFVLDRPAESLDEFVKTGLEIANRRKSRAGKSLELHLKAIFEEEGLRFSYQANTEGKRRPDFIFLSKKAYHDTGFPADRLMFLGAKTTCKDRWRQILNEASRISCKYLFTLQQGVSLSQLEEMHEENVVLVVPKMYHQAFPGTSFEVLISLEEFIARVKGNQGLVERGAGAAFG